jgi:hypothetical protein
MKDMRSIWRVNVASEAVEVLARGEVGIGGTLLCARAFSGYNSGHWKIRSRDR